jgi:hypothetical protein
MKMHINAMTKNVTFSGSILSDCKYCSSMLKYRGFFMAGDEPGRFATKPMK